MEVHALDLDRFVERILLAEEPLALLIGFVLDQQVPVQKAFSGPLELRRRLGSLDAAAHNAAPTRINGVAPTVNGYPAGMTVFLTEHDGTERATVEHPLRSNTVFQSPLARSC